MRNLETDLRVHSKNHLELKTSIPVGADSGVERYNLQFYLFSPAQLNIRANTNDTPYALYTDINVRTRFSSPNLSIANIIDPHCDLSPLFRISERLEQRMLDRESERRVVYEFQTLVNNLRREMKNTIQLVQIESKKLSAPSVCREKIEKTLTDVEKLVEKFRSLYGLFLEHHIAEQLRIAFLWCDETISSILIEALVELFIISRRIELDETLIKSIERRVTEEEKHRRVFHYVTDPDASGRHGGETVSYRSGMLKKWSQSSLYIRADESRLIKRVGHIIAGTAAAAAMSFAVLASLYAQKVFGQNTFSWVLVIVLAYVFKDRLKEVLRGLMGRSLPKLLADHIFLFRDPVTDERVGNVRERIEFLHMSDVPGRIRRLRTAKPNPFRELLPEEDIIYYSRNILINSRKLQRNHSRLEAISEIIRIRLDKWFKEMDDPEDLFYSIASGEVKTFEGKKVYHLHLIIELSKKGDRGSAKIFYYKVVVSKKGILRIITL